MNTTQVGDCELSAVQGDLTAQDVDAIVNAANIHLQHGGGVAAAIVEAGGDLIQTESTDWVRRHGPLQTGQAAVTSAGHLPAQFVIHVAGPIYRTGQDNPALLQAAVVAALEATIDLGIASVAMPAISAGVYGYPRPEATKLIAETCAAWLRSEVHQLKRVHLVGYDQDSHSDFCDAIKGIS